MPISPKNTSKTRAPLPESLHVRDAAARMLVAAGQVAMAHFRQPLGVELKADESPVTRADRATERALRELIAQDFPDDGIFGEEYGQASGASGATWIIDPIDGTRSFISGHLLFGMLLGRMVDGQMQACAVNLPAVDEVYTAARGAGAALNGQPIAGSGRQSMAGATIYINEGERIWRAAPEVLARLMGQGQNRRFSYDCAPYGLLAAGHVDVVVDAGLEPYDYLPVGLLVEEAGGVMTDWQGNALGMGSDMRVAAAATPELHAELLSVING